MFVQLVIAAVIAVAAILLMPKPAEQKPASMKDIDIPTAEQGRPIPVVFGTYVIKSSNIVWWGDLGYKKIKAKGGK